MSANSTMMRNQRLSAEVIKHEKPIQKDGLSAVFHAEAAQALARVVIIVQCNRDNDSRSNSKAQTQLLLGCEVGQLISYS